MKSTAFNFDTIPLLIILVVYFKRNTQNVWQTSSLEDRKVCHY